MKTYLLSSILVAAMCALTSGCSDTTGPSTPPPEKKVYARVHGTITIRSSDTLVEGATVVMTPGDRNLYSDSFGRFSFDSVPIGGYNITIEKSGFKSRTLAVQVTDSAAVEVKADLFRLAPEGTGMFYVIVLDNEHQPLEEVRIRGTSLLGLTDTTGKITLQNYSTQSNQILYSKPGYDQVSRTYFFGEGVVDYDTIILTPYAKQVLWYSFASNGADSSGNGLTASISGGTFVNDRHGLKNRALRLNGSTDYVRVPNSANLNFGTTGDFTICFWLKKESKTIANPAIVSKTTGTGNDLVGYELDLKYGTGSNDYAQLEYTIGTDLGVYSRTLNGANAATADWQFCAMRVSRKSGVFLTLDDETSNTTSQVLNGDITNAADLLIGRSASGRYYNGAIDELMIFDGVLSDFDLEDLRIR